MSVISTIQITPASSTQPLVALAPMPGALNRKNTYWPATWARLAMTSTSAATMAHPPAQPVLGPNALVAHVNVVPQSGSALFSSLYPIEVSSIGTNARMVTAGDCTSTTATTKTRVAAMLYAGATEAVAMIVVEISPRAPDLRPLSTTCSPGWVWMVAMAHPSWQRPGRGRAGRGPALSR